GDAAAEVEAAAAGIGAGGEALCATLPWQAKPFAPQDPDRRDAFEAHLRKIVEAAFGSPVPDAEEDGRAAIEAEETPVLATACGVCRGGGCDRGGTTGMLEGAEIARWRKREPELTPEEAIAAYLGALPEEAVAGSCVYLGTAGCALPRAMRANWCNRFQCRERASLQAELAEAGDVPVLMVTNDSDNHRPGAVAGWSAVAAPVYVSVAAAGDEDDAAPDVGG